jgi:hypothetical protein
LGLTPQAFDKAFAEMHHYLDLIREIDLLMEQSSENLRLYLEWLREGLRCKIRFNSHEIT